MTEDDPRHRPGWPRRREPQRSGQDAPGHPGMSNYPADPYPSAPYAEDGHSRAAGPGDPHAAEPFPAEPFAADPFAADPYAPPHAASARPAGPPPGYRAGSRREAPPYSGGRRDGTRRMHRPALPPLPRHSDAGGHHGYDGGYDDGGLGHSGYAYGDAAGYGLPDGGATEYDPFGHARADHGGPTAADRGAQDDDADGGHRGNGRRGPKIPRKITVTRVAAMRSRQLTVQGIDTVRRAANADGADKSGLTALIWAYMANFACDAALTVALANTLFFSAATGESKTKVALYLLVTLAPFAVIAPLIGPALDRIQRGRRIALASSYGVRVVLAIILALNFDSWVLYPAALGMLVMSKSFSVLKSAVTPRLLPPDMDLVRVNSRLQIFGLVGGTTVAGGVAGAVAFVAGSSGALWLTAVFAAGGAYLSMRIPAWVEVTEGEVATTFTYHGTPAPEPSYGGEDAQQDAEPGSRRRKRLGRALPTSTLRQPLGHNVLTGLWGTGSIKVLIGFMFLYIPFVAKDHADEEGLLGLLLTGLIAVAAGGGNVVGNAAGARIKLRKPATVVVWCTAVACAAAAFAAGTHVLITVAVAALLGNIASALSKVSLDAAIQQDLPDRSRASAFGRSETILQLSWVLGGALGVMLPTDYWIGFTVIACVLAVGLVQTVLIYLGRSVIPALSGRRPDSVAPEVARSPGAGGISSTTRSTR